MKKSRSLKMLLLFLVCAGIASTVYGTSVPNTLNYQGTLTDSTGKPISAPAKPVTFKLYTTALGGTAFWTEPQAVPVTNGQFSAVLGSTVPLPTDKFTGNTYIGVTVESGLELLPRQKMTSVAYALKAADAIPKGVIVMWSGAVGQIPEGWALCDGQNGTPNLRDRFIVGAGSGYVVGAIGGEATHILTAAEMPSHTHTQNPHNHIQNPHKHSYVTENDDGQDKMRAGTSGAGSYGPYNSSILDATATNQNTTATNQNTGSGQAHENRPPYYALAFIMKL